MCFSLFLPEWLYLNENLNKFALFRHPSSEVSGTWHKGALLTSSTPPSNTAGSETQHPPTGSHCTERPPACSVMLDLEKEDKDLVSGRTMWES